MSGVEPGALQVEITEDAMVVDFDTSIAVLNQLRDLGIQVAIDDFGTGYSSLQHLHRLPVDHLKIDRSFIARLTTDESAAAIVRASINLANDLGLRHRRRGHRGRSLAQGRRRLGCDEIQGYLVSRPLPVHEFIGWAHAWNPVRLLNMLTEPSWESPPSPPLRSAEVAMAGSWHDPIVLPTSG